MRTRSLSVVVICSLLATIGFGLFGWNSVLGQNRANSGETVKNERAPAVFHAKFETTAGDFVIEVHRDWAVLGADRFYNLVKSGFYDDCKFFRVIEGFMAQFGDKGDPAVRTQWKAIKDDPVIKSNKRGFVTFAKANVPNSRSTQVFINFANNGIKKRLDQSGFAPFGEVIEGMDAVDKINSEYGELPESSMIQFQTQGNKFLEAKFPKLDSITKATIVESKIEK